MRQDEAPSRAAKSNETSALRSKANLRGRNLRYAILDRSAFQGADFTLADLTGASFIGADLFGAIFGCASANELPTRALWRSFIDSTIAATTVESSRGLWITDDAECTNLRSVNLSYADLRGTHFVFGQASKPSLRRVNLFGARLDGVDLSEMTLELADLGWASLVGANLRSSNLTGANLTSANLTGADLSSAQLHVTALALANLNGANLVGSQLVGADLTQASFLGAELTGASFIGAHFDGTSVWGATPPRKNLVSWSYVERLADMPSRTELESAKRSLEEMPANTNNSDGISRLTSIIAGSEDNELERKNANWTELLVALKTDANEARRNTIVEIITDDACSRGEVAEAIEFWTRPIDTGWYELPRRNIPSLPFRDDSALDGVSTPNFNDGYDYVDTFTPYAQAPIAEWFNLRPLVDRLRQGTCAVAQDRAFRAELLAALEKNQKARNKAQP
jgi:uncharacterized protein YjbI with pentapeptide repeats